MLSQSNLSRPKITVVSIAKTDEELEDLRNALSKQTFQDFEFVTSTKRTIPEAWNDAISRSHGEFIVFTESDAIPMSNEWLQDIAKHVKRNAVLKGLEINPTDMNLCNLVCDASIFERIRFDESFPISEDTELFARLRRFGVKIERINSFPVIHSPTQTWNKTLSRGLMRGVLLMKIVYLHGRQNIDDVNTRGFKGRRIDPVSNRVRIITENLLVLFGLLIGAICYLPLAAKHKSNMRNGLKYDVESA